MQMRTAYAGADAVVTAIALPVLLYRQAKNDLDNRGTMNT